MTVSDLRGVVGVWRRWTMSSGVLRNEALTRSPVQTWDLLSSSVAVVDVVRSVLVAPRSVPAPSGQRCWGTRAWRGCAMAYDSRVRAATRGVPAMQTSRQARRMESA